LTNFFKSIRTILIWDIQKNIEAEEKEALNIEEAKEDKKRNKIFMI
tara:strand:+ start:14227 stop:14364 length:138 start_codon:yes stop_codon:yes gene_type:complete